MTSEEVKRFLEERFASEAQDSFLKAFHEMQSMVQIQEESDEITITHDVWRATHFSLPWGCRLRLFASEHIVTLALTVLFIGSASTVYLKR